MEKNTLEIIEELENNYGIKNKAIIETMEISKPTYFTRLKSGKFKEKERKLLLEKYGCLIANNK